VEANESVLRPAFEVTQRPRSSGESDVTESKAVYVDFTDEPHVKRSHACFEAEPLKNAKVKKFFQLALTGERAEKALKYDSVRRVHRLKSGRSS